MARDEDWKRRRRREDEAEEARTSAAIESGNLGGIGSTQLSEKLDEILDRAERMIDQLNGQYQMYLSGVELRPPIERRKMLDQLMESLSMMSKPTSILKFRYTTLQGRYLSHRDRWDKLQTDIESGKIKRSAGPKKPGRPS